MKIKLQHIYNRAYWEIKYDNGKTQNIYGINDMRKIIESANGPIEIIESRGYQEHSELIKLVKSKNKSKKKK